MKKTIFALSLISSLVSFSSFAITCQDLGVFNGGLIRPQAISRIEMTKSTGGVGVNGNAYNTYKENKVNIVNDTTCPAGKFATLSALSGTINESCNLHLVNSFGDNHSVVVTVQPQDSNGHTDFPSCQQVN